MRGIIIRNKTLSCYCPIFVPYQLTVPLFMAS